MRLFRTTVCLGMCVMLVTAMRTAPPGRSPETGRSGLLRTSTFFGCETGFAFETNGEAARCRRAASVVVGEMIECPRVGGVALAERIDQAGQKDMCASATTGGPDVSVERSCPPNYTKRVLSGRDRCEMPAPEMIRAPSIPVAR
jgi:hypothetical protein